MKSGTLNNASEAEMNIVMTGHNVKVPTHYRVHVTDKLAHLQRYNSHLIRYDVELNHENNPRQSKACQRVEITGTGNGPTVRAEASGPDFYTALDAAVGKLEAQLRRNHDRRRAHHSRHQPPSVTAATALCTDPTAHQHSTTNPLGWGTVPSSPLPIQLTPIHTVR
jgi:ribosomal subunit interface protein